MEIKIKRELNDLLDGYAAEMARTLQELIRIRSVVDAEDETKERAPYGEGVQEAFDYVLNLGREKGFECVNLENRAGELIFGEGGESVGVISHLDVVPEGKGWTYPPYGGVIDNGNIYGRGSVDDKGCFTAAFYACLALKESGLPLGRKVKQIFGTNEERGKFPCIQYYKKHTKDMPVCGIVPDSWFPVAFAEKGIVNFNFTQKYGAGIERPVGAGAGSAAGPALASEGQAEAGPASRAEAEAETRPAFRAEAEAVMLLSLRGGEAYNVVAPDATAVFAVTEAGAERIRAAVEAAVENAAAENAVSENAVMEAASGAETASGVKVLKGRVEVTEADGRVTIRTIGKSAHASTPEIGVNAIALLLQAVEKLDFGPAKLCETLHSLAEQIGRDSDGGGLGIRSCDASGPLTNNVGVMEYADSILQVKMNIRCPVTMKVEELTEKLNAAARKAGMTNEVVLYNPHFYMDPEDELIQMLVGVYQTMTGDTATKPKTHGGGSYARILKNFVPFGPSIEGEELSFHKQDEHISCERLLLLSKIYAQALYQMAK